MDKKTISIRLSEAEYNRLIMEVKQIKRRGRKTSASKYVTECLRQHWDVVDLFQPKMER